MKKGLFLLLLSALLFNDWCYSQIDWLNYSTSYSGDGNEKKKPVLVSAIPYAGNYVSEYDHALNPAFDSLTNIYVTEYKLNRRQTDLLYSETFDSSNVYFSAPGIHLNNAAQYEFRVLLNGKEIVAPWSRIRQFTDSSLQLNAFSKKFAFLGGYKTTWGNYLTAELREKTSQKVVARNVVIWMQTKPVLLNIYTAGDLQDFLKKEKKPYDLELGKNELKKWKALYPPDQIDSITNLPKRLILRPEEKNVIFYLRAGLYKRQALEYSLIRNGKVLIPWKENDFDNNYIWLRNMEPGNYVLQMRFSAQRHNVTTYPFGLKDSWYQTLLFKIAAVILFALSIGAIFLFFRLIRQKRKMKIERAKKEKLHFELRSIRSQLNPHFIFNALNSIQGLINKNEIAAANRYLSEFGNLLRDSLATSDKDFTDLNHEIATLETYLNLERLRFGFRYQIDVERNINPSETELPSFLLQPLVENAVKHGISA